VQVQITSANTTSVLGRLATGTSAPPSILSDWPGIRIYVGTQIGQIDKKLKGKEIYIDIN